MKKILMLGVVLFSVLMIGNASCFATPPLGVATDTGFYAYTDPDAPTDAWIQYFATNGIVPAVGELEGFILGPSGSNLTIFTNYNPATYSIYLIASTEGNHLPMTFGGTSLTYDTGNGFINGQADGYTATPYAYVELVDNGYSWEDAPDAFP
ncbi:MAG: hypothetical protein KAU58_04145, partial [Candidatus Omnitrophica bacterium]|nr:hypothetical protein [Candidatus Omnitrophota bacterium]